MWQIIADCYKIKLIIIIGHQLPRPPRQWYFNVIPRGDHNNRPIFLFFEGRWEYRAVRPFVDDYIGYRYEGHMPTHYTRLPNMGPGAAAAIPARANQVTASNLLRCPFLQVDRWNLPLHPPAGIPAPFGPPDPVTHDANPNDVTAPPIAAQLINDHLNPSSGRWM